MDDRLRRTLKGAALPGMIVAFCMAVGIVIGVAQAGLDVQHIVETAKIGILLGLFFSIWGGLQMTSFVAFGESIKKPNWYGALGYFLTWAVCVFLIFGLSALR